MPATKTLDRHNRRRTQIGTLLSPLLPVTVGAIALVSGPAAMASVQVNVSGLDYTVDSFLGSYAGNTAAFGPPQMPWWGNNSLASQFAHAVAASLGTPNPVGSPITNLGPYFASQTFLNSMDEVTGGSVWDQPPAGAGGVLNCTSTSMICTSGLAGTGQEDYYATAMRTPVPGPLPAIGALGALGWSRRLRERLRRARLEA